MKRRKIYLTNIMRSRELPVRKLPVYQISRKTFQVFRQVNTEVRFRQPAE
jgi:thiamine biosynthesis protein ThiC